VVYAQAYTLAFRDCFLIVTLVFILALIPAWVMGRKARVPDLPPEPVPEEE
jgi:hypothetical protein